jgi:hypothetical protein
LSSSSSTAIVSLPSSTNPSSATNPPSASAMERRIQEARSRLHHRKRPHSNLYPQYERK